MPDQNSKVGSVLKALLGTLGLSALAGLLVTVMVAPAIAVTGVTATNTIGIFEGLPDYLELSQGAQQNEVVAVDADGELFHIADVYFQNREEIPLDEMSPYLVDAAISGEDRRFYEHGGVDAPSVVRAGLGWLTGDAAGGASTLTMQTVRNVLVQQIVNNPENDLDEQRALVEEALEVSFDRKLQEMKYAISLEKRYTKKEILQAYLNIAGFGGNTYGVQAASEQYFSKNASELTIAEAASLIAIVQYPNSRHLGNPENYTKNQERRDAIIWDMYETDRITAEERDEALAIPVDEEFVKYQTPQSGCLSAEVSYRFPCDYALAQIGELESLGTTEQERLENWRRGGYTLVLSIDPALQLKATQMAETHAPKDETRYQLGAAISSTEVGTGRILVMAQNKSFDNRLEGVPASSTAVNYNVGTADGGGSGFQPGSTYKPYVLLAFLDAGHGINESFNASKRTFDPSDFRDSCIEGGVWGGPTFDVRNDAGESGGYTVARGTAGSVNSVFMQMAEDVDQCRIKELAQSIGVHRGDGAADGSDLATRPSCAIGGCENNTTPLTQSAAYAAIANQGVFCEPIMIDRLIAHDGTELEGQSQDCRQSLVTPSVANTAAHAMASVMAGGGTAAISNPNDGTPYIGKTGTTDDSIHTWMVGTSTEVSTAVWVGNIKGKQPLRQIGHAGLRHDIFKPIAIDIDKRHPGKAFPAPDQSLLTGSPVYVPSGLIGGSPDAAKNAIELAELTYQLAGEVDSDLPEGVVARVEPGEGAAVPRGTTVQVWVSNGEESASVPDVVSAGQSYNSARQQLRDAGFRNVAQVCTEALPGDPPGSIGTVVAQNPEAGAVVDVETEIQLTVREVACGPGRDDDE